MGCPKSWRTLEIEQQVEYGFTPDYVRSLCEWSVIKDYAWILHDLDALEDGTLKAPHIHLMLRFNDSVPTSNILKKLEGVCEVQHLEHIKSWNAAMAYLCHDNKPDKHQYDHSCVVSNFDWQQDAEKGVSGSKRLSLIVSQIDVGIIKRYNIFEYVTADEYVKWKLKLDNAFAYRDIKLFNEVNRKMDVLYIYGEPGTGKTVYAKQVAADRKLSVFISSGGNDFLDGYSGQECIILDDFRGSQAPLNVVLKLLDNDTASSVPSRYHNKSIAECKLVIITTVYPMEQLFKDAFSSDEPFKQFQRRCKMSMCFKPDTIVTEIYNKQLGCHVVVSSIPNLVLDSLRPDRIAEDNKQYVAHMLGGLGDLCNAVVQSISENDDKPVIPSGFIRLTDPECNDQNIHFEKRKPVIYQTNHHK